MTTDVSDYINFQQKARLEDAKVSADTTLSGHVDKAFGRKTSIAQAVLTGSTVGTMNLAVSILPKNQQEVMQPLLLLAKGIAGVGVMALKSIDAERDRTKLLNAQGNLNFSQQQLDAFEKSLSGLKDKKNNTFNKSAAPDLQKPSISKVGGEEYSANDASSQAPKGTGTTGPAQHP